MDDFDIFTNSDDEFQVEMADQTQLRLAAEKNVLTYLAALGYDQKPRQLVLERSLNFAPLPAHKIDPVDPAANSACISIDYEDDENSLINGNFLAPSSGKNKMGTKIFCTKNIF